MPFSGIGDCKTLCRISVIDMTTIVFRKGKVVGQLAMEEPCSLVWYVNSLWNILKEDMHHFLS